MDQFHDVSWLNTLAFQESPVSVSAHLLEPIGHFAQDVARHDLVLLTKQAKPLSHRLSEEKMEEKFQENEAAPIEIVDCFFFLHGPPFVRLDWIS